MRDVDKKDLVVALKSASEEMEFQGLMRLSEVEEEVQLRIVQQVRQLEEQGQITIIRCDTDNQFV